jgi:hypothetical protein
MADEGHGEPGGPGATVPEAGGTPPPWEAAVIGYAKGPPDAGATGVAARLALLRRTPVITITITPAIVVTAPRPTAANSWPTEAKSNSGRPMATR